MEHLTINELIQETTEMAKLRGYYKEHEQIMKQLQKNEALADSHEAAFLCQQLSLVASEVYEAIEAHRKQIIAVVDTQTLLRTTNDLKFAEEYRELVKRSFQEELADIFIRLCAFCGYFGFDNIEDHIRSKIRYTKLTVQGKDGKSY